MVNRGFKNYFHALRRDVTDKQAWFGRLLIADLICWLLIIAGGMANGHTTLFAFIALGSHCLWMRHAINVRRVERQFTVTGWDSFLDGREDLGEYEELGGRYVDDEGDD